MSGVMLLQLGMPLAMAISGLVAWRVSRRNKREEGQASWRDDSLDEWRRERAAEYERERIAPSGGVQARQGQGTEGDVGEETARSRIGG